ncbi:hypothetical protein [Streptomyces sp. NPDC019890]|uniref:hypothetical protein n=1 Tax=Streptomyces sp. NPDC019890 TaxID=3365064 RepID=UPI00384D092D
MRASLPRCGRVPSATEFTVGHCRREQEQCREQHSSRARESRGEGRSADRLQRRDAEDRQQTGRRAVQQPGR